jgi:carboxymethylenebutenolidase
LWIVYPERIDNAEVVLVIHEIFGLTDWIRSVADSLAAEGFIAIAPDLLSGKAPGGGGSSDVTNDGARSLIRSLDPEEVIRRLNAAVQYGTSLDSAVNKYAVVGYCWGGGISFLYATEQPELAGAVVYYGSTPESSALAAIKAPVLGLYGGADNRISAGIPATEKEMKRHGKNYEYELYEGAGHGFLRNQSAQNGANMNAAQKSWLRCIEFLKKVFNRK